MVAPAPKMDPLAQEARTLYTSRLRDKLEPHENGKFLVLNMDTGEYEIDADDLAASLRAKERFGDARLMTMRVGHLAAYRIRGSSRPGRSCRPAA